MSLRLFEKTYRKTQSINLFQNENTSESIILLRLMVLCSQYFVPATATDLTSIPKNQ